MLSSFETTHTVPEKKQRTIFPLSSKDDLKLHQSSASILRSCLSFCTNTSSLPAPFLKANQRLFVTQHCWVLYQTDSALLILAGQGYLLTPSHPALPSAWTCTRALQPSHHRLCTLVVCPVFLPALTKWQTAFETEHQYCTCLLKATDLLKNRLIRQIFEHKDIAV